MTKKLKQYNHEGLKDLINSKDPESQYLSATILRLGNLSISEKDSSALLKTIPLEYRIKTLSDIYDELKVTKEEIVPFLNPKNKKQLSLNATANLQCIAEVADEGWEANFSDRNQRKYYLYFERTSTGWVLDSIANWGSFAGLGFGLYYVSEERARWSYNTFPEVYLDYLPL